MTEDHAPLPSLAFHLLLSLADGEKHGYAIIKGIEERTEGRVRPRSGTLYNTIQKLIDTGLVKEVSMKGRESQGPKRRYYRITPAGLRAAFRETERLAALVAVARTTLSS